LLVYPLIAGWQVLQRLFRVRHLPTWQAQALVPVLLYLLLPQCPSRNGRSQHSPGARRLFVGATCCRACGAGWPHGLTRACCLVAGDGVRGVSRECSTDMCVHKRRRYYCRDCQGAGACEHNNRRWRCRECNGAYTCEHGLIKTNCLQCELEKAGPKPLDDEKKLEGHVVPPAPQDHLGQLQPPPPPLEQGGDVQMGVSGGVVAALAPAALSTLPPSALVGLPVEGKEGDAVEAASLVPPAASAPPPHGASGLQSEEDEANLSRVCMHKRWRVFCAECGGSGLCDHGKRKGPFLLTAPLASLASPCPASPDARFLCLPCRMLVCLCRACEEARVVETDAL